MDLKLLNSQLNDLFAGKEVELPRFDFKQGKSVPSGKRISLGEKEILIMEGIHALDPAMVPDVDNSRIFRVYASALTSLNVDENNNISTSDNRLLRRMVRDLMKYLVSDGGKTFTVTIEDDVTDGGVAPKINTDVSYREKLLDFLTQHRDHPVLQKIHNLEYLSSEDIDELERILPHRSGY